MEIETILFRRTRKKRRVSKITGQPIYTRGELNKSLWQWFSLFIRRRDRMCLMGEMWGGCWGYLQAGHVIPRGKKPTELDETNVYGQCQFHNSRHRYNPDPYKAWFVRQFGGETYTNLVEKSEGSWKVRTLPELTRLTAHYREKALQLQPLDTE